MRKDIALGGISRIPGGATSGDGDLSIAVNVANDGQGIQLLEKPQVLFTFDKVGEELLCIHTPEGEEKHYVTQFSIVTPSSNIQTRALDDPVTEGELPIGEEGGYGNHGTGGGSGGAPSSAQSQNDQDPMNPTGQNPPTVAVGAYSTPSSSEEDDYEDIEREESAAHGIDNGGTDVSGTLPDGTYLSYWEWDSTSGTNGAYVRKQIINITPYGKVTAIQAMGNTLICNHNGGKETSTITENAGTENEISYPYEVRHPAEIRYWLWKPSEDRYLGLGSKPPMAEITFSLKSTFEYYPKTESTFKGGNSPTEYKKYGGVYIQSYPYTDTVPVWWARKKSLSWVPPFDVAQTETHTDSDKGYKYNGVEEDVASTDLRIDHFQTTYSIEGIESPDGKTDVGGMKNNWTRSALGAYNKFIAEQNKDNKFVFPFYCRYAWELYDGSFIMHSNPVLMIPNSRGPIFGLDGWQGLGADLDDNNESYEKVRIKFNGRVYGFASTLMRHIKALSDKEKERLWNWKDLIRGIAIFVTPQIYNYNQGGQVFGWHSMSSLDPSNNNRDPWLSLYTVGETTVAASGSGTTTVSGPVSLKKGFENLPENIFKPYSASYKSPSYCLTIPQKEESVIRELHENAGQFFRIADLTFEKLLTRTEDEETHEVTWGGLLVQQESGRNNPLELGNNKLMTIASQELMKDDNHSHDTLSADILYGYNRRLNMAGVRRKMCDPLPLRVQWGDDLHIANDGYPQHWQMAIYARNGARMALVKTTEYTKTVKWPQYVFYPDPNAYEAVIAAGGKKYKVRLKEHKVLNGVFWLGDFYNAVEDLANYEIDLPNSTLTLVENAANRIVDDSNKIYTTDTDNPFHVSIGNINVIGDGEVRALASATQAMSQGQFGQHPMYAFTSTGVWALTVDNTGGWGTVQPMTRDVIGTNSQPLSLDSTVIFLTERGLLQLAGATVEILSDALSTTDTALDLNKFSALTDAIDTKFGLVQVIPSQTEGEDPTIITTMPTYAHMRSKAVSFTNKHFPMGDANLGYDSDNQRIYVTPHNQEFSWVYNIKSRLWTQATTHLDKQIVSYPELVTQQGSDVILISVDGGAIGNRYPDGLVVTRPIKFQDMGLLKKWREMILRGQFKNYTLTTPMVMTALWGTRDWNKFALVASSQGSRITRWGGSPYFGHVVLVALHGNSDYNIQVNGIDVDVTEEQINKLR